MNEMATTNDYGFSLVSADTPASLVQVEQTRAMHEVQAPYVIAKKFPRDENVAYSKVMKACARPFLADQAMYAYPRGGQVVSGPSIRLAEVLAQCWGNIDFGIVEISQSKGLSVCKAYAIDLETNTPSSKTFHVPHERHTKKGVQKLTDPRDIYELVANYGARRLRNCILAVLPGDLVDAAVKKCEETLTHGKEPIEDRVRKLITAFSEYGINVDHIERRLGHKLSSIIPTELVTLGNIYKSLRDGMAKREDFFEISNSEKATEAGNTLDNILAEKSKVSATSKPAEETVAYPDQKLNVASLKKQLLNAKSLDTLNVAADLISSCPSDQQEELKSIYHKRKEELK